MSEQSDQALESEYFQKLTKQMDSLLGELLDTRTELEQERQLFEMGPAIIFRWGIAPDWPVKYVSTNVFSILGHQADDLISGELHFSTLIHPDDIDNVTTTVERFLEGEEAFFEIEYRLIDSQGNYHWLFHHAMRARKRADEVGTFIGYVLDITERKEAEEQLSLAATAMESSVAISITAPNGNILRVNEAFSEITGYAPEEIIGKNHNVLSSGKHEKDFFKSFWQALTGEGYWEGEIWNKKKSGELFPEWISVAAVKDSTGVITHYVATFQDISERKLAEKRIEQLAYFDPLTNLPNRRLYFDRLSQELVHARRLNNFGAVMFVDLDRFKQINDSQGHAVGDSILMETARRLTRVLREGDTASRLGGDEFVALIPNLGNELETAFQNAGRVADKLFYELTKPYELPNRELIVTASIGIILFPDEQLTAEDVMKQADMAMYQAKESGRNSYHFYRPSMQQEIEDRYELEQQLNRAVKERQFVLYYQPKVDRGGSIVGAEALLRWNHPERGLVFPNDFVPVAENSRLIIPMSEQIIQIAADDIVQWQEQNLIDERFVLSINISAIHFSQDDFEESVVGNLLLKGADLTRIELELTEGVVIKDYDKTIEKMSALSELGIRFSIDDFGTGYSSLQYLHRLPINTLKIDRAFVKDVVEDSGSQVITKTIISMGRNLGLELIAEGVEESAQRQFLETHGCYQYQGYLFSRPLSEPDFREFLKHPFVINEKTIVQPIG
ncbi:MAG: EAL domain-containing protein [Gammaproteobacteria bacterium]|nr:EAL domain-containing protein [Gammaproteobacteria bacterium]